MTSVLLIEVISILYLNLHYFSWQVKSRVVFPFKTLRAFKLGADLKLSVFTLVKFDCGEFCFKMKIFLRVLGLFDLSGRE